MSFKVDAWVTYYSEFWVGVFLFYNFLDCVETSLIV